jgi:YHS domain-containing protein
MAVDASDAAAHHLTVEHGGTRYAFCSEDCRKQFAAAPGRFVTRRRKAED